MTRIVTAGPTTTAILGIAAVSYDPTPAKPSLYRVVSNRAFHIRVKLDGSDAVVDDMYVPLGCIEYIRMNVNDKMSTIKAAGETDGNIWFTLQREEG